MGRPSSTTVLTAAAAVPGPRSGERRHLTASCAATPGSGDQLMSLEIQHNHGEGPYTRFQPGDGPSRGLFDCEIFSIRWHLTAGGAATPGSGDQLMSPEL